MENADTPVFQNVMQQQLEKTQQLMAQITGTTHQTVEEPEQESTDKSVSKKAPQQDESIKDLVSTPLQPLMQDMNSSLHQLEVQVHTKLQQYIQQRHQQIQKLTAEKSTSH